MKLIDKIKKNKLLYFLGVLIVGIFIVLIVRFTYAYLAANVNEARGDVSVDSDETDNLKFAVGDPLSIDATPTTLPENGENLVDTTTATATLLANSTNNTAEYPYWVYFTISNNTFVYSDGSTPEIILTVTDPEGNPVTNIDGLTYGTFNGVAGFDVTAQNGKFTVANGYTITSNSSTDATEQTWNFTLTYLNLPTDQSANFGNSMITEVSMSKEEYVPTLAEVCTSGANLAGCISEYNALAGDGTEGIYYHDGSGTYTNADQEAGDNSYRFSGANPNNYVCFGTDEVSCPEDNLYRIIGVFNGQVKLIKSTSYGKYVWESDWATQGNTWDETTKPDIYTTLNTTYYNTLGSEWQSKIATHSWKVGGMARDTSATAKDYYDTEVGTGQSGYEETMKIGLMYVSDYGYGASEEYWTTELYNYEPTVDSNWMHLGSNEWTISRYSDDTIYAFIVSYTGFVLDDLYNVRNTYAVRPSFYLESSVVLTGGTGTSSDPYRIS